MLSPAASVRMCYNGGNMKKLLADYPKLLLFVCAIVISYLLYRQGSFHWISQHLDGFGYASVFLAGMFYSFGFTSPFAVAHFVEVSTQISPVPAAVLGGLGAAVADMGIFTFVSVSLREEFHRLRSTAIVQRIHALMYHETRSEKVQRALQWTFASIIIASPLPDEVGMSLIAGLTNLESRRITAMCFLLNTAGILVIFLLSR